MRLVVDSLIALLLVAVLAGVLVHHLHAQHELDRYQQVHHALGKLYEQAIVNGSNTDNPTETGFPLIMKQVWFEPVPINVMIDPGHPWLDIAPPGDMANHPPDPIAYTKEQAGFWYNPNRGIFRARIKLQFAAADTLELYNQLNNCTLKKMPQDLNPARNPMSLKNIIALTDANSTTKHQPQTSRSKAHKNTDSKSTKENANSITTAPSPRRQTLNDVRTNQRRP